MRYEPRFTAVLTGIGVAVVDIAVVVIPITDASLQQVSFAKVAFALALQSAMPIVFWALLEVVFGAAFSAVDSWLAPFKSKMPFVFAIGLGMAFMVSASLLYNGAVCGDYPFALHKNRPLCPRSTS